MNRAQPWGAASLGLGILTLVGAIVTVVTLSGDGPLLESASAVVLFGVAAVATGVRAHRTQPGGATSGSGLGLAGILTGVLGMVATVGWFVLSVAFVVAVYLYVALAFALSGADLAGTVLGAGL